MRVFFVCLFVFYFLVSAAYSDPNAIIFACFFFCCKMETLSKSMILFNSILLTAHLARFELCFRTSANCLPFTPTPVSLLYCQYGHTQHYKLNLFHLFLLCYSKALFRVMVPNSLCIRIIWRDYKNTSLTN